MISLSTRVRTYDLILICQNLFYIVNFSAWLAQKRPENDSYDDDSGSAAVLLLFNFSSLLTTILVLGSSRPAVGQHFCTFARCIGIDYFSAIVLSAVTQGFNIGAPILFTVYTAPYLTSLGLGFFATCWSCLSLAGVCFSISFFIGEGNSWPLPPSLLYDDHMLRYTDEEELREEDTDIDDGPLARAYTLQIDQSREPAISISSGSSSNVPADIGDVEMPRGMLILENQINLHDVTFATSHQTSLALTGEVESAETDQLLPSSSPRARLRRQFLPGGSGLFMTDEFLKVCLSMTTIIVGFSIPTLMLILSHTNFTCWPDWVAGLYFIPPSAFLLCCCLFLATQRSLSSSYRNASQLALLVFAVSWVVAGTSCISVAAFLDNSDPEIKIMTDLLSFFFVLLYFTIGVLWFLCFAR